MSESFEIAEVPASGPAAIIRVEGRLDAQGSALLLERAQAVRASGRSLVFNLNRVTFLASSAIATLLMIREEFHDQGLSVRLACTSKMVRTAIALMNLGEFLTLHDTEEQAVRAAA